MLIHNNGNIPFKSDLHLMAAASENPSYVGRERKGHRRSVQTELRKDKQAKETLH